MWESDGLGDEQRAENKFYCHLFGSWIYLRLTSLSTKGKNPIVRNGRKRNFDLHIVFLLPQSGCLQWESSDEGSLYVISEALRKVLSYVKLCKLKKQIREGDWKKPPRQRICERMLAVTYHPLAAPLDHSPCYQVAWPYAIAKLICVLMTRTNSS